MRKVQIELIVPEGVSLSSIVGIVEAGCGNFIVVKENPRIMDSERVMLSPELVREYPRNDDKVTLLLTERPYYEPVRRHDDEEE